MTPCCGLGDAPVSLRTRRSQRQLWDRVHASYEVLTGCPFVPSKTLLTLGARQADSDMGRAYYLRTRLPASDTEEELARILGLSKVGAWRVAKCHTSRASYGVPLLLRGSGTGELL